MAIALRIYGLAHAEILVQRARGTPIGLAYAARENVLMTRSELAYAQQWLADEPENPAARAEVARCQQACLTASVKNTVAWGMAAGANIQPDETQKRTTGVIPQCMTPPK